MAFFRRPNRIHKRVGLVFCMACFVIRTEFMDELDWISAWSFKASEEKSWTSPTGFLYSLFW